MLLDRAVVAVAVLALAAAASGPRWSALSESYTYEMYARDFGKVESSAAEREMRRGIFARRLGEILAHNADSSSSYKKGVNQFTDRTDAERKAVRGLVGRNSVRRPGRFSDVDNLPSVPSSFDWRDQEKPVVTPVKDQGHCGSCWAAASTATLESHLAINTGYLAELSFQELVSCAPNPDQCGGYGGCAGATGEVAYEYVAKSGLASPYSFPYVSWAGDTNGTCAQKPTSRAAPVVAITGHETLPMNEEAPLLSALVNAGPVAVSVAAEPWMDYEEGVFDGCKETGEGVDVDHLVVLVGYDEESLIIRNSWTPFWGMHGYIKLKRTTECGEDTRPKDGEGCNKGPSELKVCGMCGVLGDSVIPLNATRAGH